MYRIIAQFFNEMAELCCKMIVWQNKNARLEHCGLMCVEKCTDKRVQLFAAADAQ